MGVAIVFASVVVLVSGPARGNVFEPLRDVFDQTVFMVVDVDGGGDVHGADEAEAVVDAALMDDILYLGRKVHHLVTFLRVERQVGGVGLHCGHESPLKIAVLQLRNGSNGRDL